MANDVHTPATAPTEPDIPPPPAPGIRRFMTWLFIVSIAMTVLGVLLNIYVSPPNDRPTLAFFTVLIYPNAELNVHAWFSALLLALMGVMFLIAAVIARPHKGQSRAFLLIGIVAVFLSADEAAALHERLAYVAQRLALASPFTYQWVLIGVPIAIIVGIALLWVARALDRTLRNRLIIAGAVFLLGAVGFETLGAMITKLDHGLPTYTAFILHDLSVMLEEGCELIGTLLGLRAILYHLHWKLEPHALTIRTTRRANA